VKETGFLFVYGTLGPATPEEAVALGFEADAVRGRLFDLGPYPALLALDDHDAPWIEGHVRQVTETELRTLIDPYEGVDEGLFIRSATTTRGGRAVWVYVYARPLPQWAEGGLTRWDGPRIDPTQSPRPPLPPD
jgi:gamma-glutamylcyclotransferase (GGCT)/AIG2-like uncharacterized protein YtfP